MTAEQRDEPVRPFVPTDWARNHIRGFSVGRNQRHCAGCERFLPLWWSGKMCQGCVDTLKAKGADA